jgi:hypothetical protein
MTMRKLIEDDEQFMYHLAFWNHQGMAMDGFKVVKFTLFDSFEYEPVVFDFHDPDIGYVKTTGPYKSWRGAFSVIGASYDKIDKDLAEKFGT